MTFELPEDLDAEILDELIASIQEALDEIEPALETLAANPNDEALLNDIFRNMHTIKGNFRMCFLTPFTDYVHGIEESISEVRKGSLPFSAELKETSVLALDRLRHHMDIFRSEAQCETQEMESIGNRFLAISLAENQGAAEAIIHQLLTELRGGDVNTAPEATTVVSAPASTSQIRREQLQFFQASAEKLELKVCGHTGKAKQMIMIAEAAIPHMHSEIDSQQMAAAIYMHDIGMGLMSNTQAPLCPEDQQKLNNHPNIAYQYLIKHDGWQQAADYCAQHHEKVDGTGYPQQLKEEQISAGAQLLAVIDYFCEQVQLQVHLPQRRAILNALVDTNKLIGSHFSGAAVQALNLASKQLYLSQAS